MAKKHVLTVGINIGYKKFEEMVNAGVPFYEQDYVSANEKRIAEMIALGKVEVRPGHGDTANSKWERDLARGKSVSASMLIDRLTSVGASVVSLRKKVVGARTFYMMKVQELQPGVDATELTHKAQELILKASRKHFRKVTVWTNPDGTVNANLSGDYVVKDQDDELDYVYQLKFDQLYQPSLV